MSAARSFLLLPSLALAAACSDGGSEDLPPGEATLSLDGLVTEQARVFCQLLFSCDPDGSDNLEARLILETPVKCQQYLLNAGTFDTADLVRAVKAGVVRYDGAAAKRCVAAIGQNCASLDFETSPEVCEAVFVGTVAAGGACQRSEECSGAAFCAKTSSAAGAVCPGRCTAQRPQGTECDSSSQCDAAGLTGAPICTFTQEGEAGYIGRCRERKVGAAAAVGQVCGFDETTATGTPCAEGLVCGRNPRVCVAPLARGASCSPGSSICAGTDACRAEAQGGAPVCGPIQVVSTAGVSCASPTTYCNPLSLLTCEAGTCAATRAPGGGRGNSCDRGDFSVPCDAGLYCAGAEGNRFCESKLSLGDTCQQDDACLDGSCVDGRCEARDCRAYWE